MGAYFKPRRRKFGVVTLVIASAFAAGWVRSLFYEDHLDLRFHKFNCSVSFSSYQGKLGSGFATGQFPPGLFDFYTFPIENPQTPEMNHDGDEAESQSEGGEQPEDDSSSVLFGLIRFGSYGAGSGIGGPVNFVGRAMSSYYSVFVIPLALLSAWLLLSKIRDPKPQTESATSKA